MLPEHKRLLLIESHKDERDALVTHFQRQGYIVSEAQSGDEALAIVRPCGDQPGKCFDLVLLDISELGNDNYGLIQQLKNEPLLNDTPIAVITTSDDTASLKKCIDLGVDIAVTLKEQISKMERDLEIGRQIQTDFLPRNIPQPPGWEIVSHFAPARDVAGDFYDVFNLPGGKIALVLGDVCDKGVGPALFMSLSRSIMRAFSEANRGSLWMKELSDGMPTSPDMTDQQRRALYSSGNSALLAVELANSYLVQNHGDMDMFFTLFFGVLDLSSGVLNYINGGHEMPFIVSSTGEVKAKLAPTGPLVGIDAGAKFMISQTKLDPGDLILVYSDGVVDARRPDRTRFTHQRLLPLLQQPITSATDVMERLKVALVEHISTADQYDDITVLAVRRQVPAE